MFYLCWHFLLFRRIKLTKKISRKALFNIISLTVPVAFIVYFFMSENGLIDLLEKATTFNWIWIVIAICCQFGNIAIDAYVLFRFTNNYDKNYTLKKAIKATVIGQFYSVITPGAVGGQPMQIYCMRKQNVDMGVASSSLIQKFLVYQTTITLYSFVALLFNFDLFQGNLSEIMLTLAIFGFMSHAVVIIVLYLFSFNRKWTKSVIEGIFRVLSKIKIIKNPEEKSENITNQLDFFHKSNTNLYKNKKMLCTVCLLTVVQLTLIFVIPYAIYRAFKFQGAKPFDMITGQAFVTMVSSFMPLPGGSGAAEGSFYIFFSMFFTQDTIKSAILIWRIITYFLNIIVFAPFSRIGNKSETKKVLESI